jgi:colanic acid biosynthesis glycosyl transferase WcaI
MDSQPDGQHMSAATAEATSNSITTRPKGLLLVFSQVFVPDPASVGQHMADVAFEMARRGWDVRVYAASRGYDDPTQKYSLRETRNGVEIRRLRFASFGKKSLLTRGIGMFTFITRVFLIALFTPSVRGVFFSTSPPMIGFAVSLARLIRRYPTAYWAMDLNPDQLIAMGKMKPNSFAAWVFERINRFILKSSTLVIALDRFMADRLAARVPLSGKMVTMPPWPHEEFIEALDHSANPFRARHNLNGKFVIMYSGNHSPSNPLTTLLDAAVRLKDDPGIVFLFVGGGIGKKEVEQYIREHKLTNAVSLPYQPLAELKYSLPAADVHVVSLGANMVGIIHPCKIYGAMAVARPVLFFGPKPSHISDLLEQHAFGFHVEHGDVEGTVATIGKMRALPAGELKRMGALAAEVLSRSLSQEILCVKFCDSLEAALGARHG